jgi:hypothetical protein
MYRNTLVRLVEISYHNYVQCKAPCVAEIRNQARTRSAINLEVDMLHTFIALQQQFLGQEYNISNSHLYNYCQRCCPRVANLIQYSIISIICPSDH